MMINDLSIAFLGTGLMGSHMATNLSKAGFAVRAWNRTRKKAEPLAAFGASVHDSAAEAANGARFVITMLTDGPTVDQVLFTNGLVPAMGRGSTVIDMSSIKPEEARSHSARLAESGIAHLDAPVSGGTRGAEEASLAIMAGGPEKTFEEARQVFKPMGRAVRVGPAGAGQTAKLCNQGIVAVTIGVVAEAMLLMEKSGGDPVKLRDALKGGFADSVILQQHGERMTNGDFQPGGLSRVQLKDLDNIEAAAQQAGLKMPLTESMRERYRRLVDELDGGNLDHSAIFLELLDRNGMART